MAVLATPNAEDGRVLTKPPDAAQRDTHRRVFEEAGMA
jgi:hypothetical protein